MRPQTFSASSASTWDLLSRAGGITEFDCDFEVEAVSSPALGSPKQKLWIKCAKRSLGAVSPITSSPLKAVYFVTLSYCSGHSCPIVSGRGTLSTLF